MSNLSIFEFNRNQVRVVCIENEPWFVAKDVCSILGLDNVSQSLSRLDKDEKRELTHPDIIILNDDPSTVRLLAVSESGMYALVLSSRKPESKPFRKWITSEVIPTIRKTGFYGDPLQAIAQQIQSLQEENQLLRAKTRLLESQAQPDFSKLQEMTQHLAQSNPEMLAMMVEKFAIACYEMGRKKNKKLPETVLLPENTFDADDIESLMPIIDYIKQNNGEITTREICRKFNRNFIVDGEVRNMNSKVAYRIMEILAIAGYGEIIKTRRNSIKFEIFATFT